MMIQGCDRGGRVLLASLVALAFGCLLLAPGANAATQSYGFSDTVWGNPYISHTASLSAVKATGAKYWRTPVNWQYYEPQKDQFSQPYLQYLYDEYTQMMANGQTPIFTVFGTPYWALSAAGKDTSMGASVCADNNNATQCFAPPDVRDATIMSHWQTFLATLAYVMPKAVFEIWNEPNLAWFWVQPQDPALYGLMLKSAGDAIHGASSTAKVISGSVNNYNGPDTTSNTSYPTFLSKMYTTSGKTSFDALGFHTYPCNFSATTSGWTQQVANDYAKVRLARNAAGDTAKPLWLTETGASTGAPSAGNCGTVFTETQQGSAMNAVLKWTAATNTTNGDLPVVLEYSLFDSSPRSSLNTSNGLAEGEYGLIGYTTAGATVKKAGYTSAVCLFTNTCQGATRTTLQSGWLR